MTFDPRAQMYPLMIKCYTRTAMNKIRQMSYKLTGRFHFFDSLTEIRDISIERHTSYQNCLTFISTDSEAAISTLSNNIVIVTKQ